MLNYKKTAVWVTITALMICAVSAICLLTNPKSTALAEEDSTQEIDYPWTEYGPEDPFTDGVFENAQTELDRLYELGILNSKIELDRLQITIYDRTEETPSTLLFGRTPGRYFIVKCSDESRTAYVNMYISAETGKALYFSVEMKAQNGDPLLNREPLDVGNGPINYYDCFHRVLRDDITVDELCSALNEYWGFNGYTLGKTVDDFYKYDLEAPDGDMLMKDRIDGPYATVYFDGDEEGAPMFLEVMYFPGRVFIGFGAIHAVG